MKKLMKKFSKVLTFFVTVLLLGSLVSCAKHEHTFSDEWMFDKDNHWHPATCEHVDEKGSLAAHEFNEWTTKTKETCTEAEVLHRTCKVCGYEETKTGKAATGHSFSETYSYDDTYHWHAATCGHTDVISDKAKHTYGDWIIDKEPTCTEVGLKHKECICHHKIEETIPVLAHSFQSEWTYDDTDHWHKCKNCDAISDKANHTYGDWVVTKPATCTTTGTKEKTCTVCGQKHTETIPVLGHSAETNWTTNYTHHWHKCSECNAELDKEPHTLEFIKDPSLLIPFFEEENYLYYAKKCSVCGFHIPLPDVVDIDFIIDNIDYIEEVRKEEYSIKFIDANGKDLYGSAPLTVKEHDSVHFTSETPTLGTFVGWKIIKGKGLGNIIKGVCPDLGDTNDIFTLQAVYSDYVAFKISDTVVIKDKGYAIVGAINSGSISIGDVLYYYDPVKDEYSALTFKVKDIEEGITHIKLTEINYTSSSNYGLLMEGLDVKYKNGYLLAPKTNMFINTDIIQDKIYDGNAVSHSITALHGTASVMYKNPGSSGLLLNPPTNVGKYIAVVKVPASDGYLAIEREIPFEIKAKGIPAINVKLSDCQEVALEPGKPNPFPNHKMYSYKLKDGQGIISGDDVSLTLLVPNNLPSGKSNSVAEMPKPGSIINADKVYLGKKLSGTDAKNYIAVSQNITLIS